MRVLVIASQKGGVGKTTLAGHLGVMAEAQGAGPVALLDTDPQGSLSAWWNEREAETPAFARATLETLPAVVAQLAAAGVKTLIIDTPPAITEQIRAVVRVADLVLIPSRPSPHDLRAVGGTADIVEAEGKPMVFVVNGATQRARLTGEAAIALSQHGAVATSTVYTRTDFAASMIDGRTAQELAPGSKGALEIAALWDYVSRRMAKACGGRQ